MSEEQPQPKPEPPKKKASLKKLLAASDGLTDEERNKLIADAQTRILEATRPSTLEAWEAIDRALAPHREIQATIDRINAMYRPFQLPPQLAELYANIDRINASYKSIHLYPVESE